VKYAKVMQGNPQGYAQKGQTDILRQARYLGCPATAFIHQPESFFQIIFSNYP
jgi:hypothetical protein